MNTNLTPPPPMTAAPSEPSVSELSVPERYLAALLTPQAIPATSLNQTERNLCTALGIAPQRIGPRPGRGPTRLIARAGSIAIRKSWSGDLHAECTRKFGGDCHWVTLHGNHGGGGAHVLLSPPQGREKHRRIVFAPEGSGLEHLRMDGMGENSDIRARATAKTKAKGVAEKQRQAALSPEELDQEKDLVHWQRDKLQKLHDETHQILKDEFGPEFDTGDIEGAEKAVAGQARAVLKDKGEDAPKGSGEITNQKSDIKTGEEPEEDGGKRSSKATKSVREAVVQHAAAVLASDLTGAAPSRSRKLDDLSPALRQKVEGMSPESAHRILNQIGKVNDFRKKAKNVLAGRMTRQEAETPDADSVSGTKVEKEVRQRIADQERVRYNSALWQQVGEGYSKGAPRIADAFTQGGTEAISALVSKSLGNSVSPGVIGSLGISGVAHVLANELKRTGGAGSDVRTTQDLIDYIELEADSLRDEAGPLSEVSKLRDQMRYNESLLDTDLNRRTVASLNAKLSAQAQQILGNVAGRLEAGAELARAVRESGSRTSGSKGGGDLTLKNGTNPTLLVAQMEAAGLSPKDYTVTKEGDDKASSYSVTIKAAAFPKVLQQSKRDATNEAIRKGQKVGEYKPPAGWTDDPKLQLTPKQIPHVQFQQQNRRTLSDASTGFGKTPVGLADTLHLMEEMAAKGRKPRVLILTTAGVRDQYGEETEKFAPGLKGDYKVANGTVEENAAALSSGQTLTICAHDALVHNADDILKQKWDLIVVDEADKLISPSEGEPSIREGVLNALSEAAPDMHALTATPLRNTTKEYWKLLHVLRPTRFPKYDDFSAQYENLGAGTRAYDSTISEALSNETRDTVLSSRLGEGSKHEHRESTVPIMSNPKWREMHAEVERQYAKDRQNPDKEIADAASARRYQEHIKVSYDVSKDNPAQVEVRKHADEGYANGERGIIFADTMPVLDTFRKSYKEGEWMEYSGKVDAKGGRREELKHALNRGAVIRGVRVAFDHEGKGAEGVVEAVHHAPGPRDGKKKGKPGAVTGYTIKMDDGSPGGKHVTVPVTTNMTSKLRGLVATKAAQYGLNLQEGGRYVMRFGHPYTPTAYEQEVGRLRSREQSDAGRDTWDRTIETDHPVAGTRRRDIFEGKSQLTKGREHYLRSDEYGV